MATLMDDIRKIPPVTRFLCGALVTITLSIKLEAVPFWSVMFTGKQILKTGQIWRPFTSFFIGDMKPISFIIEVVMFYRNSLDIESKHFPVSSADYAWQLFLVGLNILILNLPLGSPTHTHAFLMALIYLSCALAPAGAQTSFWGLVTLPVKYLPYVYILMDYLNLGPHAAAVSISGAVVAHLWWWGVWDSHALRPWARAPWLVRSLMGEDGRRRHLGGGVYVEPPERVRENAARGMGIKNWGGGRRLGD
ncbi:hypothetical protein V8D89_014180 [Ganoderma adspersum]